MRRLLALLVEQGVVTEAPPIEPASAGRLEREFQRYLEQERRLAPATVLSYLGFARCFLDENCGEGEVRLDRVRAADVVGFVQREAARLHHAKRAKLMTAALRSLLQFARYRGLIKVDLRLSVPTVANWSMASLPRALSSDELQRLLSGCERESAVGCRNWAAGEICIRGAGMRADRLPIPQEVGEALAGYLRHVRPACASRQVFVFYKTSEKTANSQSAVVPSLIVLSRAIYSAFNSSTCRQGGKVALTTPLKTKSVRPRGELEWHLTGRPRSRSCFSRSIGQ